MTTYTSQHISFLPGTGAMDMETDIMEAEDGEEEAGEEEGGEAEEAAGVEVVVDGEEEEEEDRQGHLDHGLPQGLVAPQGDEQGHSFITCINYTYPRSSYVHFSAAVNTTEYIHILFCIQAIHFAVIV